MLVDQVPAEMDQLGAELADMVAFALGMLERTAEAVTLLCRAWDFDATSLNLGELLVPRVRFWLKW